MKKNCDRKCIKISRLALPYDLHLFFKKKKVIIALFLFSHSLSFAAPPTQAPVAPLPLQATLRDRQGNVIILRPEGHRATIHLQGTLVPNQDTDVSFPMVSEPLTELSENEIQTLENAKRKQGALNDAYIHIEAGEFDLANDAMDHALMVEKNPSEQALMLTKHASTLLELNQPQHALKAYQRADALSPQIARLSYTRLLSDSGENHKAIELLTDPASVKLLNPAERFHLLGIFHQKAKHYEVAANYLRQAIELQSGESFWHYELGLVYELDNKSDLAQKQYIQALKLKPDSQATLTALERTGLTRK